MADIIKYRRRGAIFVNNLASAYNVAMIPLCEETHLKVHQLDMLLFLCCCSWFVSFVILIDMMVIRYL